MINPGEYAAFARMDRALVTELERRLRDEDENALKLKMLEEKLFRSMAELERHERETR
jgi:hypothetical protein